MKKTIILFIFVIIIPIIMAGCGVCDCQKRPSEYVEVSHITIIANGNITMYYPNKECGEGAYLQRTTYKKVYIKYEGDYLIIKTIAYNDEIVEHPVLLLYQGVVIRY